MERANDVRECVLVTGRLDIHSSRKAGMKFLLALLILFVATGVRAGPLTYQDPLVQGNTYLDIARAGDRLVVVGDRGFILYSDDRGQTWQQGSSPTGVLLTAVCFANDQIGWAVGHDAVVLGTRDGGQTWQQQYSDELDDASGDAASSEDEFAEDEDVDIYADDYDIYADEGDISLVDTSGAPLLDVWCQSADRALAVGGYGYLLETSDGGSTWEKRMQRLDNPDGWHLYAISAVDGLPHLLFIAGEQGTLFRSQDAGTTWEKIESPYHGSFFGITSADPATLLVHGLQGNLWLSRDRGDSWTRVVTGLSSGVNAGTVLPDGTIVLVGNSGAMLLSRDKGSMVSVRFTPDRQTFSSVVSLRDGSLITVGAAGIRVINDIR